MRKSMRNRLANKIILLRQPFKNFLSNRILFFSAALSCLSVLTIEGIIYKYRSIMGKVREFYNYLCLKDELYPSIVLFILALGTMLYFLLNKRENTNFNDSSILLVKNNKTGNRESIVRKPGVFYFALMSLIAIFSYLIYQGFKNNDLVKRIHIILILLTIIMWMVIYNY